MTIAVMLVAAFLSLIVLVSITTIRKMRAYRTWVKEVIPEHGTWIDVATLTSWIRIRHPKADASEIEDALTYLAYKEGYLEYQSFAENATSPVGQYRVVQA